MLPPGARMVEPSRQPRRLKQSPSVFREDGRARPDDATTRVRQTIAKLFRESDHGQVFAGIYQRKLVHAAGVRFLRFNMRQLRPDYTTWHDPRTSVVVSFPVPSTDGGVVKALQAGHPGAIRALTERYSADLLRIAGRILGPDAKIDTLVTQALRRALARIDQLEDATKLRAWLTSQVISATRRRLRMRRVARWLPSAGKTPKLAEPGSGQPHFSAQLLASYRVLDRMSDDQRIVFCLVVIHAMSLAEAATLLEMSLITCRTSLDKACGNFMRYCQLEPVLQRLTVSRQVP